MLRRGIVALVLTGILSLPSSDALATLDYEEAIYIGKVEAWSGTLLEASTPIAAALDHETERRGTWKEDLIPLMGAFGAVASDVEDTEPPGSMVEVHDAFLDGVNLLEAGADDGLDALRDKDEQAFLAIAPDFIEGSRLVGAAREGILEFQQACLYESGPCDVDAEVDRPDGRQAPNVTQEDSESTEGTEESGDGREADDGSVTPLGETLSENEWEMTVSEAYAAPPPPGSAILTYVVVTMTVVNTSDEARSFGPPDMELEIKSADGGTGRYDPVATAETSVALDEWTGEFSPGNEYSFTTVYSVGKPDPQEFPDGFNDWTLTITDGRDEYVFEVGEVEDMTPTATGRQLAHRV